MPKRIGHGRRRTRKPQRSSRSAGTAVHQLSRELTRTDVGSSRTPAASPVDVSRLARVVPDLAPETLHQIIRQYGLDACAEIVGAATPAQLRSVFDLDLWRSARPGHDERFDPERFGEWLELLVDAGGTVAARTVAAMDEDLVVAGLSRYVRVFDPAAFATTLDGEPLDSDVAAHDGPECEMGGYLVRGITTDAWDAIVAFLHALDADHHERFHAVMGACRQLSNSTPEVDGLDDLLVAPEQLLHDLAADREDRRSQQGYSTPADARAFLLMARRRRRPSPGEPKVNPLVAAYFRAATDASESEHRSRGPAIPSATLAGVPEVPDAVTDVLFSAGLVPQRPRALLDGADAQPSRLMLVRRLIEYVRDHDDTLCLTRSHELAFLANTLAAGCSIQSRSFTPREAADAAVGICNLGLEHWPARWPEHVARTTDDLDVTVPDAFLMHHDLVSAFEVGWAVLHEDVSMFAAGQLVFTLSSLRCSDPDIQEGLDTLRIELTKQRHAGTPWHARHALDAIAMLDMPAWASVLGLLDECPVIPAALTATLEGRTGAISATAFEFISTRSQLGSVREFLSRFLDILGR
jgi:Family of unknown function (DUF6178)